MNPQKSEFMKPLESQNKKHQTDEKPEAGKTVKEFLTQPIGLLAILKLVSPAGWKQSKIGLILGRGRT